MMNRIVRASLLLLLALQSVNAAAFWVNEQFDGQWAEIGNTDARRGLNVQFIRTGPGDVGVLFLIGFVYDNEGNQVWVSGNLGGVAPGVDTFEVPMVLIEGGRFFGGPDGDLAVIQNFATFTLIFNSCNSLDVSWQFGNNGGPDIGSGSVTMDRGAAVIGPVGPDRCVYQNPPQGCPAFSNSLGGRFCELSGRFTDQDIVLTNSYVWVLNGTVFIGGVNNTGPASVTIEPGTYIAGSTGSDALVIERGSKIFAEGNSFAPIVITSVSDIDQTDGVAPAAGDVGGLAIFGNAMSNNCTAPLPACDAAFEGLPGTEFGGDNDDDSSGILRYVQIRFAGNPVFQDQELNALSMAGVGRGTVVEFVQVHEGLDDGIELFSGAVNLDHVVFTNINDDNLDTDLGWRGNVQYGLVVQGPVSTDNGFEMDNNPNNNSAEPRSTPRIANFTLIGNAPEGEGLRLRTGTNFNGYNIFVTGFGEGCVNINDDETFTNGGSPGNLNGNLTVAGSAIGECGEGPFEDDSADPFLISDWWTSQGNQVGVDPMFIPETAFPAPGSPLIDGGAPPTGEGLDKVDYIGAFRDGNDRWTDGWTFELEQTIQQALQNTFPQ